MRCLLSLLVPVTILLSAQEVRVTVKVVDGSTGAGVPNASVYLTGADEGRITDAPETDSMGVASVMVPQNSTFAVLAAAPG